MTSGGRNRNQGRKLKYGEILVPLYLRVPKSKKAEIKVKCEEILKQYEIKKLDK